MSLGSVDSIERSVHETNRWLHELAEELGHEDREEAWRVLRAYLRLLRDRLTVDEAAQLAAQLPTVLRGVFYEGFDPSRQPVKLRHRDEFLERLAAEAQLSGPGEAARAADAATRILESHVTAGEWDDVLAQLPAELRELMQHQ
ncbi:MAG TPA: DUF2267 domain-containing protein [Solirubrobacteraceae bacterium]|jgi:uncharacterized protein (DUF2267 family)|nr:DUF2267 domain-containing protein [Solirubrobacteraceae bacterium]